MDWGTEDQRPTQRARLLPNSSQHQQQGRHAAPARPLVTPQHQHAQQHWFEPPQTNTHQEQPSAGGHAPAPPTAPAAANPDTTRWLACSYRTGVLGVAAYDRLTNELSVLQTADEGKGPGAFQMLQYVKLQVDPQVIILSATAEPALIEAAKLVAATAAGAAAAGDGDSTGEPLVQLQRPSLFTYNKALQMVSAIQVRGQHLHQQQQPMPGRRSRGSAAAAGAAAGLIDTSAHQQVAALGALVALLLQLQEEGSGEGAGIMMVDGISELQLEGHLIVDGASLAALDIFKEEEHPSAMGIGSSKEGVSVYSLLQRCVTGMGRRLLRQWFLRPVVQLDVISSRHDTIELLVAAPTTNDALRAAMKKLQDLPRLVARLRLSQARPQLPAFKQLHDSIKHVMVLKAAVAALAPRAEAAAAAAAAGAVDDGWQRPESAPGEGRQPGWLFDDADAAEAAADGFFHDGDGTDAAAYGSSGKQPPSGRRPAGGMFSTPLGPPGSSRRPGWAFGASVGAPGTARGGTSRGGAWGGSSGDGLPPAGPWDALHITQKLLQCIGSELSACCCMIADVLDLTCSLEGCLVQSGVCAPLDDLRATVDQLPDILTQYIEQELARVPPQVARRHSKQLWSVVYIPQVGFMICITGGKLAEEVLELLPDYSLSFMGEDGPGGAAAEDSGVELDRGCAYYSSEGVQQLNAQYGDLQHRIQDLEASICTELIRRLLQFGPALTAASAAVAELDCLCGLAAAARQLGYCRPQLVTDSIIHIEGGRHPLCELLAPGRFIDNDTTLGNSSTPAEPSDSQLDGHTAAAAAGHSGGGGGGNSRMLLITGPNASGKSVYMKQVALLVYMAHIGSFVPARSAVIGLTDRILTRLPGMESVIQHTSSFLADLAQVSNLLARATSRSLVLLDEFGKGTLSADGVGLLASLLQHYAAQPSPPLLLACTHFSELLDPGILPRSPQLSLCTMQVLVGGSSGSGHTGCSSAAAAAAAAAGGTHLQQERQGGVVDPEEEHVFLYKLVPGVVASSYGLHCARLCGVEPAVLTRAAEVLALQEAGLPINRLQAGELEQRDAMCWQLLRQLAALDASSEAAVNQLLSVVVKEEAGVSQ